MRVLIDTHTFLWAASDKPLLSTLALSVLEKDDNEIYLSVVTPWEISIKVSIGKLTMPNSPEAFIQTQMKELDLHILPIELRHATGVATLPLHHRDPFDRMLVSQCLVEGMPLISIDAKLDPYGIQRLW